MINDNMEDFIINNYEETKEMYNLNDEHRDKIDENRINKFEKNDLINCAKNNYNISLSNFLRLIN